MRATSTCASSYCACCVSQLSALPPNTLDKRTAISGEIPRFSFTSSDNVVRVTPRAELLGLWSTPKARCIGAAQSRRDVAGSSSAWFILRSGNRHNQHFRPSISSRIRPSHFGKFSLRFAKLALFLLVRRGQRSSLTCGPRARKRRTHDRSVAVGTIFEKPWPVVKRRLPVVQDRLSCVRFIFIV